jgi:hypothetical protein
MPTTPGAELLGGDTTVLRPPVAPIALCVVQDLLLEAVLVDEENERKAPPEQGFCEIAGAGFEPATFGL